MDIVSLVDEKVLPYASPQFVGAFRWRRWLLFLLIASLVAVTYWRNADWWVYVSGGGVNGTLRRPKFKMPLWWQVTES